MPTPAGAEPAAPASAPAPSPPRRSRRRRAARGAAFGLAGLLLLAALLLFAAWHFAGTEVGTRWLLSQVEGLRVSGGHGSLRGGAYRAERVQFELKGSPVQVTVEGLSWRDLHWRWRPSPGTWTGLRIDGLRAQRIVVRTLPGSGPPQVPRSLRLPIELELADAQAALLQADALAPLRDVRADLHLGAQQGREHRLSRLRFGWERLQVDANATLGADAPLALKARARADAPALQRDGVATPAWTAAVDAQGPLQRLGLGAALRTVADGRDDPRLDLQAVLTPFAPWPLAALQAELQSLDVSAFSHALPASRFSGHARLRSSGLQTPAQLQLQLANALPGRWDEGRWPLRQFALALGGRLGQPDRAELQRFDLQLGDARQSAGRWQGRGRWQGDTLQLDSRVDALQPALLDARLAAMTLSGPLALQLQGGAAGRPWQAEVDTRFEGRVAAAGDKSPPVTLALQLQADGRQPGPHVHVQRLLAQAGDARAETRGDAQRQADGSWQIASKGTLAAFDPLPWWPGLATQSVAWQSGPHRVNGDWEVALALPAGELHGLALLRALRGRALLHLADSRLAGVPLEGRLKLEAEGRPLATVAGDWRLAGNTLALQGQVGLGSDGSADRWTLDVQAPALPALAPLLRLQPALQRWAPSAGSVHLQGRASGRWPALASEGQGRIDDLKTGELALQHADLQWRFGGGEQAPLVAQARISQFAWGRQRADRVQLDVDGTLRAHRVQLQADTAARPPVWADPLLGAAANRPTALALAAEGSFEPERGAGQRGGLWQLRLPQLRAGAVGARTPPWLVADGLALQARFDAAGELLQAVAQPGRVQLLGGALRWSALQWQRDHAQATPRIDVQAELEPLAVAPLLARLQPDFGWGGDLVVAGHAHVRSGPAISADVVLERRSGDLTVTDIGGTLPLGLSDLRLGLTADRGVWHLTQAVAGTTIGVLAGVQSVRLPPQAVWPTPETPLEGLLELRVDNLGVWGPWTPPGWRLAGNLHVTATLAGRVGAPEYIGRIDGHHVGARHLLQGVNVSDGEVAIALKGPSAQIERFTLRGGDGTLQLDGGASFGERPTARLALKAERFEVLQRVDRRIVASGSASAVLSAEAIALDGRIVVDEGLIDFSRADAPTLDDDVSVVRRPPAGAAGAAAEAVEEAAAAAPRPPRQVDARLAVDLGQHLRLRGRGLDTLLRGDLRITTPGGRLAVNGAVRADNGTYAAYGQHLVIERGLITFSGPVENPRLDIVAVRPDLDVRVGVSVFGSAVTPRVRLVSTPEMTDSEKLSWLVLGRQPEGLGRTDTALLQRAALALVGSGEDGTGNVLRLLGLDDLSVRQSGGDGDVRATVVALGKQLSRRWYVGYERGLSSTTGTWQLIYRIAQRLTVRGQAGEENAVDMIWIWRWN